MKVLVGVVLVALIFSSYYFRTFYLLAVMTIFSAEHFFLMYYIYKCYMYKSIPRYGRIDVNFDSTLSDSLSSWIEICKLGAYKRLYVLLIPNRKFSSYDILKVLCIIYYQIPYRLIRILKKLIRSEHSLKMLLFIEKHGLYDEVRHLKIEFLRGKIYLNCPTVNEFVRKLMQRCPKETSDEYVALFLKIKQLSSEFHSQTLKPDSNPQQKILFKLGKITTEEGVKVPSRHYSTETILHGYRRVVHATSNVGITLTETQISGPYLSPLVRVGSVRPGSIFTGGNYVYIQEVDSEPIIVSKWELCNLVYTVYGSIDDPAMETLLEDYYKRFGEILEADKPRSDPIIGDIIGYRNHGIMKLWLETTEAAFRAEVEKIGVFTT